MAELAASINGTRDQLRRQISTLKVQSHRYWFQCLSTQLQSSFFDRTREILEDFDPLSAVFTTNIFGNYTANLSNLMCLATIEVGIAASVAKVDSQHLLGSIVIEIGAD